MHDRRGVLLRVSASLRPLAADDWPEVRRIYAEGIATGHATFETEPPATWDDFDTGKLAAHRFVAVIDGRVVGWAAVSAVSSRCVYRGVVEHSVYVEADARGRGIGHLLVEAVIASTEGDGVWTIQSSIFADNHASLALHARHGFRTVGFRERIARDAGGVWRDTVLIERRSPVVG
ncbi:phosphinothricin acetyltransferase [Microbacterium sp. AG157]|uniref:N-acetyltransferase n=1 Tax=Microbacterium testaceum TaxID=2033 RepID=A0A4Y3QL41_MICTE|nr:MULTISPECIES: GNAT family N-acetyltransferase [Microbacterium]REC99059.1 phosphinothricin acetyltransferase [Microbacterium sp. AG157]GEB44880.1 N-acetyltransferase [Microbacterium testaceum]